MSEPPAPQGGGESAVSSSLAASSTPATASQSSPNETQSRIFSTSATVENLPSEPTPPPAQSSPQNERQTTRLAQLSSQAASLSADIASARTKLQNPDVNATISRHIKLLHDYNAIRDVGLGLMEMLAERRGVRLADVLAEMGVGDGD